jgi:hypothetical protein
MSATRSRAPRSRYERRSRPDGQRRARAMARERSAEDAGQHHRAVRPAQLRARVRAAGGAARAAATHRRRDACARGGDDAGGLAARRRAPPDLAAGTLAEAPARRPVTGEAVGDTAAAHPVARAVLAPARQLAVRPHRHRERVRPMDVATSGLAAQLGERCHSHQWRRPGGRRHSLTHPGLRAC